MKPNYIFNLSLFTIAAALSLTVERVELNPTHLLLALLLFCFFSTLYHQLNASRKMGKTYIDYGISYALSFTLFVGPLGLFIYQVVYRTSVFLLRKIMKKERTNGGINTFYNIGSFTLANTAGYYLFFICLPFFERIPLGFWLLIFFTIIITMYMSDLLLLTLLYFEKIIRTRKAAWEFIGNRSMLDLVKTSLTNGLLYVLLLDKNWELLVAFFLLNYIVSQSFILKAETIQTKIERDQFEEMAYTDFMTGIGNRALMASKMERRELLDCPIGIVVSDLDQFKSVNDMYNHSVGDQVIQDFAKRLEGQLTTDDYLFRTGGEEFTMFLRNRTFAETRQLIENIRKETEESAVFAEYKGEQKQIVYTASFGLLYKTFPDYQSFEKGFILADNLLFEAKRTGRNTVISKNFVSN